MIRTEYKITINAPREKVWKVLWEDETYRQWTAPFSEGSRAETDWKQGSEVRFLNKDNDGMASRVAVNRPNEYLSLEHLYDIRKGVKVEEENEWKGSTENYTLTTVDGKTEVLVDMDMSEEYKDHFAELWPKALARLKELSEKDV